MHSFFWMGVPGGPDRPCQTFRWLIEKWIKAELFPAVSLNSLGAQQLANKKLFDRNGSVIYFAIEQLDRRYSYQALKVQTHASEKCEREKNLKTKYI